MIATLLALASAVSGALAGPQKPRASDVLHHGSPESVGLLADPLLAMVSNITNYQKPANYSEYSYNQVHPIEPGESVIGLLPSSSLGKGY